MRIASILLAAALATGVADAARAEEPDTTPTGRLWSLQITPYIWATGMKGNISPFQRAPTIPVEKSFSDVLDSLNFGAMLNLWARYDRFVFAADIFYSDLTDSHVVGQIPPLPPIFPGVNIGADVDTTQLTSTIEGGYRLYSSPRFTFDALAGARFWRISNNVTVTTNGSPTPISHEESFGWVDPIIAARGFFNINDKFSTMVMADVGGFGVGSDNTWQVMATVNWQFRRNMALSAGYKYLHVDYDKDGHVFDASMSGPVLGLTYRF